MKIKNRLQEAEFQELVRPKLKLFMSVDIVGSTHYKQSNPKQQTPEWVGLFIGFFADFPERLVQAIRSHHPKLRLPRLWKALGDELIFTVELEKRADAAAYVKAHASALRSAACNWHSDSTDTTRHELHLKGAAWLVGFPVGNVEIPCSPLHAQEGEGCDETILSDDQDYIGPLVDMGFRLKEHASPRKLVIAADLAYLMICASMPSDMRLFFEIDVQLKGVMRGKAYPVIWLDNDGYPAHEHNSSSANVNRLKDTLMGRHETKIEDLRNYLKAWLASAKGCPCIPFLEQDPDADFIPGEGYEERRQETISVLQRTFFPDSPSTAEQTGEDQLPPGSQELLAGLGRMRRQTSKKTAPRLTAKKSAAAKKTSRKRPK
ncbi:hypothetical protein WJU23_14535 [Prosthecobacter sp. SYSU 5D2]|uniref:hypothetical protein n=1 Tax=Prosthecobacter sp. SYSU 5D2 TaxID=3134134 RepID=UPI0031FE6815